VSEHAHGSDQLIYATEGVMEVSSGQSIWTIPPQFALWIPAKVVHRIRMLSMVGMRSLYFRIGVVTRRPMRCSVIYVAPLLRELILEVVRRESLFRGNRLDRALTHLVSAHLARANETPVGLTMPTEPRALSVARLIAGDLASTKPLARLCADAGVSVRTVQRTYRRELGIDIESWRRQARLTRAIQLLVAGSSVKEVAYTVGYRQSSAFVQAFRRLFGATPRSWTSGLQKAGLLLNDENTRAGTAWPDPGRKTSQAAKQVVSAGMSPKTRS
jgi:AraC-like DNA-binding protein